MTYLITQSQLLQWKQKIIRSIESWTWNKRQVKQKTWSRLTTNYSNLIEWTLIDTRELALTGSKTQRLLLLKYFQNQNLKLRIPLIKLEKSRKFKSKQPIKPSESWDKKQTVKEIPSESILTTMMTLNLKQCSLTSSQQTLQTKCQKETLSSKFSKKTMTECLSITKNVLITFLMNSITRSFVRWMNESMSLWTSSQNHSLNFQICCNFYGQYSKDWIHWQWSTRVRDKRTKTYFNLLLKQQQLLETLF